MSKPAPKFSMEQLVAELREALPDIDEGGVRTVEVAEALGFGETTVRKLLGQLKAQGRLQVVRRKVETLDSKQTTVRAYKLL
jgi:Mn-dependent DtxR family transcriptional regulator